MTQQNNNPQLDVEAFERAVFKHQNQNLFQLFNKALLSVIKYTFKGSLTDRRMHQDKIDAFYNRFAAAITAWLTGPKGDFTPDQFKDICLKKQSLHYIFAASGYRGARHLVDLLGNLQADGTRNFEVHKGPVLLSALNLDETPAKLVDIALKQPPHVLLPLMTGWLSQRAILTRQGEENRTRLLETGPLIENFQIDASFVAPMMSVWMYCSYASAPHKHQIKKYFNRLFVNYLKSVGVKTPPKRKHRPDKKRPTLLVVHERFTENHAMYRCFAPHIRGLAKYFNLVSLSASQQVDSVSEKIFSQSMKFDEKKTSLASIINKIQEIKPDAIFYPSVGMSYNTVFLANLRLAPVQFAALGHPATTMSEEMDYMFVRARFIENMPDYFSETLLTTRSSEIVTHQPHSHLPKEFPEKNRVDDGYFHVAVNSKVMKLSHRLLEVCQRLNKTSKKPLKFHFFPGELGLNNDGIKQIIRSRIPNSTVYSLMHYPDFLQAIRNCDLALATFPFGNSNSTVDCSLINIPVVAHLGNEPHSQSDFYKLVSLDLHDRLIADSDEKYFEKAYHLIHDDQARQELEEHLRSMDKFSRLFSDKEAPEDPAIAEAFIYAFRNHLSIQKKKPGYVCI